MTSDEDTLNADPQRSMKDHLVKDALVRGHTYGEAAEIAGVSARTVRRRMADSDFRAEVHALQAERTAQLSAMVSESGRSAVTRLVEALDDENPSIAVRAAQALLGIGHRFRREVEMIERIEALEARVEGSLGAEGDGGGRDVNS